MIQLPFQPVISPVGIIKMVKPMTQKELRALSLKDLRMRIKELNTAAKANNTDDVKAALATAQAALDRKCDQLELVQDNVKTSASGLRNQLYKMNKQELKVCCTKARHGQLATDTATGCLPPLR